MQLKKYYKDIVSLMATLSLLATVLFINKYDVKQLYREFATLRLKVDIQEKVIANLEDRVYNYSKQYRELQVELEEHNKTRGIENADLYERLRELEREILVLSDMVANRKPDTVFSAGSDVREFVDRQENRLGFYETQGTALLGWKDDYLTTSQFKLNTVGNLTLQPKIKKVNKDEFYSYIDETSIGGITVHGQGEIQKIEPPRNQLSLGPFIGVAYNQTTGLTEPIVGIGLTYNLIKIWDWR
jgi:hypothetical protein|tara:strand:+ start:443 stop:1171 length:729 start_codon:yes stop_codon:yes gene_type:complete